MRTFQGPSWDSVCFHFGVFVLCIGSISAEVRFARLLDSCARCIALKFWFVRLLRSCCMLFGATERGPTVLNNPTTIVVVSSLRQCSSCHGILRLKTKSKPEILATTANNCPYAPNLAGQFLENFRKARCDSLTQPLRCKKKPLALRLVDQKA